MLPKSTNLAKTRLYQSYSVKFLYENRLISIGTLIRRDTHSFGARFDVGSSLQGDENP